MAPALPKPDSQKPPPWNEVLGPDGSPRTGYDKVLKKLSALSLNELRTMEDRMAATLREMGVTFDIFRADPWGRQPWTCDLLPHVFPSQEWEQIVLGLRQRLRAFELFLEDVYGKREILRAGMVPVQTVLGSPHYQSACIGIPRPRNAFLHLSGMCIARGANGRLEVKQHLFSHPTGISFMLQNRRALARIAPELFEEAPVQSLTESSLLILEQLREAAASFGGEPTVVLLSPGAGSAVSSEQSFLARRMGIPMVHGGDLLVLDNCVYLKTVRGLKRVEVIFNRVPDSQLDPLVFQRNSLLGVPGLVHCVRKGTVALVNALGSQLADDRTLLAFSQQIIRFYLSESPILPSVPTLWMGDLDQREYVLENLQSWRVRPITGDLRPEGSQSAPVQKSQETSGTNDPALLAEFKRNPSGFVAQPFSGAATTVCFTNGQRRNLPLDHVVFALRTGSDFAVLPGALTRVHSKGNTKGEDGSEFGSGWTSKDSWVLNDEATAGLFPQLSRHIPDPHIPPRQVTSRVAEAFYWMGRYLERAHHQAYLISVIETLETEELNSAERKHYRPVWNRLLPPIEKSTGASRRSISNPIDRYRLVLLPDSGSVLSTFMRAVSNAESVQDSLSPEAWATINNLRTRLHRTRFKENLPEPDAVRTTRRLADFTVQLIPQFFAVAANSMLWDDGWRFCELGQMLERAIITANSLNSISASLEGRSPSKWLHGSEIELSAFLRLLGTRDAYRRIFQMRAEPVHVLELLWQHPEVPRSVLHCLERCRELLGRSIAPEVRTSSAALVAMDELLLRIRRVDWRQFVRTISDEEPSSPGKTPFEYGPHQHLDPLQHRLLNDALDLHTLISDSFLNHQARIAQVSQPLLDGF